MITHRDLEKCTFRLHLWWKLWHGEMQKHSPSLHFISGGFYVWPKYKSESSEVESGLTYTHTRAEIVDREIVGGA